jgi:hemerythrin superfamily protein
MDTTMTDRPSADPISLGDSLLLGKKVPPDVVGLLVEDHRTVSGWFAWYAEETSREQKSRILAGILRALTAHMAAEEEIFYPEAARATGERELVDHAIAEHEHARSIMAQLQLDLERPAESLVLQLRDEIAMHVREEEGQLFPRVLASRMDRYAVGALVAARRADVLFRTGAAAAGSETRLSEMPSILLEAENAARP